MKLGGVFPSDETGALGLEHDAGDVVGDDVVELPGQRQPLVASDGLGNTRLASVEHPKHQARQRSPPSIQALRIGLAPAAAHSRDGTSAMPRPQPRRR